MMKGMKKTMENKYSKFSKSKAYQGLKRIETLRKLKQLYGKITWKLFPYNYELHGDPIGQKSFVLVGKELRASSIIETGTFLGFSAKFMAENFPKTKILTCELKKGNFKKAKKNLKKYKNVNIFLSTSPKFLSKILEKKELVGECPLIYLDAHWFDDWPLEEELKIISEKLDKAIIIIDDFKIPGKPHFMFDKYKDQECSVEMISPYLNKKKKYNLLLPSYGYEVFKKDEKHPELVGYPIIFQNLEKEFKNLKKLDFIKRYFTDESSLIKR